MLCKSLYLEYLQSVSIAYLFDFFNVNFLLAATCKVVNGMLKSTEISTMFQHLCAVSHTSNTALVLHIQSAMCWEHWHESLYRLYL